MACKEGKISTEKSVAVGDGWRTRAGTRSFYRFMRLVESSAPFL